MRTLAAISNTVLQPSPDSKHYISTMFHFTNAAPENISIPLDHLGQLFELLFRLAELGYANNLLTPPTSDMPAVGPITLHGTSLSLGTPGNDSDISLILDTPALRLAFRMTRPKLDEMLAAADQSLLAAQVPRSDQPN